VNLRNSKARNNEVAVYTHCES